MFLSMVEGRYRFNSGHLMRNARRSLFCIQPCFSPVVRQYSSMRGFILLRRSIQLEGSFLLSKSATMSAVTLGFSLASSDSISAIMPCGPMSLIGIPRSRRWHVTAQSAQSFRSRMADKATSPLKREPCCRNVDRVDLAGRVDTFLIQGRV